MITIYIPICAMNSLHAAAIASVLCSSYGYTPVILDQNSPEIHERNLRRTFPEVRYVKTAENKGIAWPYTFAQEDCQGELAGVFHSDLVVYEQGWNNTIDLLFEKNPKLGMVGFFGAMSALENGGRATCTSAMIGWQLHTPLYLGAPRTCAVLDGMGMVWRQEAIKSVGGFDTRWGYEVYDRHFCLQLLEGGWEIGVMPLQCYHVGSVDWAQVHVPLNPEVYGAFNERWKGKLPWHVESRFLEV